MMIGKWNNSNNENKSQCKTNCKLKQLQADKTWCEKLKEEEKAKENFKFCPDWRLEK